MEQSILSYYFINLYLYLLYEIYIRKILIKNYLCVIYIYIYKIEEKMEFS